jgi:hypothetical protein
MKKLVIAFHPSFYVGSGMKNVRIRNETMLRSGSGIKHPGYATQALSQPVKLPKFLKNRVILIGQLWQKYKSKSAVIKK